MARAVILVWILFVVNVILSAFYHVTFGGFRFFLAPIVFLFLLFNLFLRPVYKLSLEKLENLYGTENRYKTLSWVFKDNISKSNFGEYYKRFSYAITLVFSLIISVILIMMPFIKSGTNLPLSDILPLGILILSIIIFSIPAMIFLCRNYRRFID